MKLEIYYPVLDDKNKIANIGIQKQKIFDTQIKLEGRSKVAFLIIENLEDKLATINFDKKEIEICRGLSAINVTGIDMVEFSRNFNGYIYAIGEWENEWLHIG